MPRSRYKIVQAQTPHFLTMTINNWLPVFTRPETVNIIFQSWRYLQHHHNPPRSHALRGNVWSDAPRHGTRERSRIGFPRRPWEPCCAKTLPGSDMHHSERRVFMQRLIQAINAQRLLGLLKFFKRAHKTQSTYQLWEEGSHPQLIESESIMRQKLDYIHYNPVKRGYVDKQEDWRYSSARVYAGQPGL